MLAQAAEDPSRPTAQGTFEAGQAKEVEHAVQAVLCILLRTAFAYNICAVG